MRKARVSLLAIGRSEMVRYMTAVLLSSSVSSDTHKNTAVICEEVSVLLSIHLCVLRFLSVLSSRARQLPQLNGGNNSHIFVSLTVVLL